MKLIITATLLVLAGSRSVSAQNYSFIIFAGQTNAIGTNDGIGQAALFNHPRGLAAGPDGSVYVADTYNAAVRKITAEGQVTTMSFSSPSMIEPLTSASIIIGTNVPFKPIYLPYSFTEPQNVIVDTHSNLYVNDQNLIYIAQNDPSATNENAPLIVEDFAGSLGFVSGEYEPSIFNFPCGMAFDTDGNLYVADQNNQVIRKVTPEREVSIVAGLLGIGLTENGFGTNAGFSQPFGVAFGRSNTLYVTDATYYLREIVDGNLVTNFWSPQSNKIPHAVATDLEGNVYVVGGQNGTNTLIRITPAGDSTILGVLPTPGQISGIAVDSYKNIYLSDQSSSVIIKAAPVYPSFFAGSVDVGNSTSFLQFSNGNLFGYFSPIDFPNIYHDDLGWEYFIDANDGQGGAYLYDYASQDFLYTSPSQFPYLYDFTLSAWLYYYADPATAGRYSRNPRYFYDFGTGEVIIR